MTAYVLDAGALIAYERNNRNVVLLVNEALDEDDQLVVPAGVIGQVWRDGARQARLASLLNRPEIVIDVLDEQRAREAGILCGAAGSADVIDASVVLCALQHDLSIVTSDPDDLVKLDSRVQLVVI